MIAAFKEFIQDERGLEMIEYAVIMAVIVTGVVGVIIVLKGTISDRFIEVDDVINTHDNGIISTR